MAKVGRPIGSGGVKLTDTHRDKIQKSNILNALIEHVEGKRDMSPTQVSAGLGLLRKCLPDLSNVEISGDAENPLTQITRIELVAATRPTRADDDAG